MFFSSFQGTSETRMPKILLTSSTEFQLPDAIPIGTDTPQMATAGFRDFQKTLHGCPTVDGCEILHQLIDGLSHYL